MQMNQNINEEKVLSQVKVQILAAAFIEVPVEGLKNIKTFGSAMQKTVAIIFLQLHHKEIHLVMIRLLLPVNYSKRNKFIVKTFLIVLKLKTMKRKINRGETKTTLLKKYDGYRAIPQC